MTLTATRSLHTAIPVPPPPRGDEEAGVPAAGPCAPAWSTAESPAPPAAWPAPSPAAGGRLASALDLDAEVLDSVAFTRPQTSRPPRPRPIQPPTSIDEAGLRRQRLWVMGATGGFGVTSVAAIASWFL